MKKWLISLILLAILSLGIGLARAQEEETYSPEEAAPEVVAPVKPSNAVQNIEIEDLPDRVRLTITTAQPPDHEIGKIKKEKMFYIDFVNAINDLPAKWKKIRVNKGPVSGVRSSQYQVLPTKITRIVVDLDEWVKHEVAQKDSKLYLDFYKVGSVARAPAGEQVPPPEKLSLARQAEEKRREDLRLKKEQERKAKEEKLAKLTGEKEEKLRLENEAKERRREVKQLKQEAQRQTREEQLARREKEREIKDYYLIGKRYYGSADYQKAIREFEKVLEINPLHKKAKKYLSKCQTKMRVEVVREVPEKKEVKPIEEGPPEKIVMAEEVPIEEEIKEELGAIPTPLPPGAKVLPPEERLVSLSFTDASMSVVLNFLAEMSGYNIVTSVEATAGTVTINLKDVPVMTALDTILEMQGLWYRKEKNIIRVMTIEEFKTTLAVKAELTRVYRLQYAVADTLATVLNSVLGGAVQKETLTRSVRLESVEAVERYTEIAGLKFTGMTFVIADKRTNSVIVTTDAPENLIMLEKLIKQLDREVPQVLIEVAIVDVTLTDEDKLGINWTWKDLHTGTIRGAPELAGTMEWIPDITGPYALFLSNLHIDVLIQALAARNKANILSSPRILTLDNEEAIIKVGTSEPMLKDIIYYETTDRWKYVYEYEDIGTTLTITPQINPDKFVRLKLKQEVRRYKGTRTVVMATGTAALPIYDIQEATASMLVKDGHTVIMGGMIKEEIVETKEQVPFLGSIPGLGILFRKKELRTERKELIMLVTPHVITSPGEAREVTEREKRLLTTPPRGIEPAKKKPGVIEDVKRMTDIEGMKKFRKKKREEKPAEEKKEIEIPELEEKKK